MRRWPLIAVAALAGCEQWKAPQRIEKMEDRIDELAEDVAELRGAAGKPRSRSKPKDEHAKGSDGSGEPAHGADSDEAKDTGHAAAKEPASSDDEPASKVSEDADKEPEKDKDKDEGARDHAREPDKAPEREKDHEKAKDKPSDKGKDPDKRDTRALEQLNALAASGLSAKSHDPKPHWSYEGKTGPASWGKLDPAWKQCIDGKEQSPIDIEPHASKATPIAFHYRPTAATVVDNGHTLQVNLAAGSSIEIDGRVFDLLQFHFHTPSEHTIAGEHYPLEVHLVHQGPTGKLAVIGVLYDVGADSRPLSALWPPWPRKVGVADKLAKPFDPSALLPETRTVYRYAGSLTTPPCAEGVLWNVMRRTPSDGRRHLEAFGERFRRNAREVQPRNDRAIE